MTKTEYAEKVAEKLNGSVVNVAKANGVVLTGISMGDGLVKKVLYVDNAYNDNMSIDDAVNELRSVYENSDNIDDVRNLADTVTNWDKVKDYLRLRLYHEDTPAEVFRSAKKYGFDDLIIIPYIENIVEGGSIKVNNQLINQWGVTKNEVFATAKENTKNDEVSIQSMREMLALLMPDFMMPPTIDPNTPEQIIVTNERKMFGAYMVIAAKKKLKKLAPNGYYVLPSSVHEVIIVPVLPGMNKEALDQMVDEVNVSTVAADEVLGHKAYLIAA